MESKFTEKADLPCIAGGGAAGGGDPRNRKGGNDWTTGHAAMRRAAGIGTISVATEPGVSEKMYPGAGRLLFRDYPNPAPAGVHDVIMRQGLWMMS